MNSPCIFCASPTFSNVGGGETQVKSEVIISPDDHSPPQFPAHQDNQPSTLLVDGNLATQGNSRSLFILKNILKLSNETLSLFPTQYHNNGQSEDWIRTCASCGKSVHQCIQLVKQISSLEKHLLQLETELKGKIEQTKYIQSDGDPVWTQVRKEVLTNSISQGQDDVDVSHFYSEADDVDLEPASDLMDLKEEGSPPSTQASEAASSSLFLDPVDDNPPVLSGGLRIPAKRIKQDPHRLFEVGGKLRRGCLQCPYSASSITKFQFHLELHEEGAPHTICESCGYFLRQGGLGFHLPYCPAAPKASQNGGKKHVDNSSPHYTAFTKDNVRKFKCRHCIFEAKYSASIREHAKLHEEGAETEICKECGCFVRLGKIAHHFRKLHGRHPDGVGYTVVGSEKSKYYKCTHCPFQTKNNLEPIREHLKLHEKGARAEACEECGRFVVPERLKYHMAAFHSTDVE